MNAHDVMELAAFVFFIAMLAVMVPAVYSIGYATGRIRGLKDAQAIWNGDEVMP